MSEYSMDHRQQWISAELAWVRHLLAYVLRDESGFTPFLSPWVETILANPGKMLRPQLVLIGGRLGAGDDLDYLSHPIPDTNFDTQGLEALKEGFRSHLRTGKLPLSPIPEFQDWKASSPFVGGLPNHLYLLAVAIEVLHLASLAHDDVIDSSPLRRGQASAPALMGDNGAILVGDLLFTLCFALVNEGASGAVAQTLAAMVRLMVRSELAQAEERRKFMAVIGGDEPLPGRRHYLRTIGGKTALLFAMSLTTGAGGMGAAGRVLKELQGFGFFLGLVFQMVDDVLDLKATGGEFGKEPGKDIRDGQLTLPLILGLNADKEGKLARKLISFRKEESGLQSILDLLEDYSIFKACRKEIDVQTNRARRHLDALKACGLPKSGLADLERILNFVVKRQS